MNQDVITLKTKYGKVDVRVNLTSNDVVCAFFESGQITYIDEAGQHFYLLNNMVLCFDTFHKVWRQKNGYIYGKLDISSVIGDSSILYAGDKAIACLTHKCDIVQEIYNVWISYCEKYPNITNNEKIKIMRDELGELIDQYSYNTKGRGSYTYENPLATHYDGLVELGDDAEKFWKTELTVWSTENTKDMTPNEMMKKIKCGEFLVFKGDRMMILDIPLDEDYLRKWDGIEEFKRLRKDN